MKFDYAGAKYKVMWRHCMGRHPMMPPMQSVPSYSDPATECLIFPDVKIWTLPVAVGEFKHPKGGMNHPRWRQKSLAMALQRLIPRRHHTDHIGATERRNVWDKFFSLRSR